MSDEPRDPPQEPEPPNEAPPTSPPNGELPPPGEPPQAPEGTATIHRFPLLPGGKGAAGTPPAATVDGGPPGQAPPAKSALPAGEAVRRMGLQQRREFVYDARVNGWTWHALAKHCGVAVATMQRDYEARRRQVRDDETESRRHLANARLEEILKGLLPKVRHGDAKAAEAAIKAIESQRRLYGDDAPLKVASTTPDGQRWAPLAVEVLAAALSVPELRALEKAAKLRLGLPPQALDGEVVNGD